MLNFSMNSLNYLTKINTCFYFFVLFVYWFSFHVLQFFLVTCLMSLISLPALVSFGLLVNAIGMHVPPG